MQRPQLVLGALALCLLTPSRSESNPSDAAVEGPVHRVPLSALQTSESVSYHVPAAPPGSNQGGPSSHHTLYQSQQSVTSSPPHRRFPAIAMLFPTTLTPYASPPSSSSILHHHLRESSGVSTKYQSAEQYEPPRRPSTSQFGSELPRPGRREPQQQHHHHQQQQSQHQHTYGGSVLPKLSSPYSSYAQGLSMDQAEKRPQDLSAYEAPPVVPDAPPRFLYERPLVEHERSHGRPMTSLVESSHYEQQQPRERPSQQQQQQQSSLYGSSKYATSAQLRNQYAPQVVTEKPLTSPPLSSYVSRPVPESRMPVQEEQTQQQQQQPSRKLHPSQPETSPIYSRYGRNSQENTRLEEPRGESAEKSQPAPAPYQSYPMGLYGASDGGGRNSRRRYNLVYIPVDVLKKLLTEAGYKKKK
ncbi:putative cyclin-dependent serine/threonine-protein kinase DDB_G0272797/DDB_G0274007 [Ixodes scapularis]|uniref:putative cyclin-dependent serine/threonine-protein kinase DDB_G0272797/DDB_G0274007 n=1 Tax=Ixodes scapularis TaxID=6945 RepID=UPI001C38C146|nr:putative cyclin-dependent serine/threonine-protein kinase DDB_G0272797/DDB_G0274007 [Ixodes scapularis]